VERADENQEDFLRPLAREVIQKILEVEMKGTLDIAMNGGSGTERLP